MALPGYRNINGFFFDDSAIEKMTHDEEIRLYQEMRNNDPIASTSVDVLKSPLLTQTWDLKPYKETPRSAQARDYLYKCLEEMGFDEFRYHYFLMLDFGACWFEPMWVYKEGEMKPKRFYPIKPDTVYKVFMKDDEIDYIIQRAFIPVTGGLSEEIIEGKNLFHDCYNKEFDDPRGRSIFKPIRPYYLLKKNLLQSDARLRSRAAGIVVGEISEAMAGDSAHRLKFQQILQGIGNNIDNFALIVKDQQSIKLETPQNQDKNLEMLQFFNQQIFYNTQTQFMLAGIGAGVNGGRANTDSHKGTYINKVNSLLDQFDYAVQKKIIEPILAYSQFAVMAPDEVPIFETSKLSIIDTYAVADAVQKLGHVLKLTPADEVWFRSAFGMPEVDISQIQDRAENVDPLEMSVTPGKDLGRMTIRCQEIIELDALERGFETIEQETEATIWEVYNKAIKELAERLAGNPANVKLGKRTEIKGKLKRIYNDAKKIGKETMTKEIDKAVGKSLELELLVKDATTEERLALLLDRVWTNAETAIKNDFLNTTVEQIDQAGGVEAYIMARYEGGNKKLLADVAAFVEGGIIDGRGEIIDKYQDDVVAWEYTSIMDKNTCKVCEPRDGQRKSLEQWQAEGMQIYSPVNPGCEGGIKCRCVLVPIA